MSHGMKICKLTALSFNIKISLLKIPSRESYIVFIEELTENRPNACGLDIGTGASCIYPLLGVARNSAWKFIATESNEESLYYANLNITLNELQTQITLIDTNSQPSNQHKLIPDEIWNQTGFLDFTMCNPPFYSSADEVAELYSRKDPHPHEIIESEVSTFKDSEGFTEGGESKYVRKMIEESLDCKGKIGWCTTLLGKKNSAIELAKVLMDNALDWKVAEIRRGRTVRWCLAWNILT
ncbi:Methyltransferase-like protein 16 [Nowakowskiella sp. JEL0407]|nr:Methyltransferase-like protein 16 [Nowakowskiella sp. JEL0407]